MVQLDSKKHMRTVYEQPCRELYKIDDPALFFHALTQVVQILRCMMRAGCLHGNVNPDNFLMYHLKEELPSLEEMPKTEREDWVTVVSDLEYCRPFLGGSRQDPVARTSYYTAVEVQCSEYMFDLGEATSPALDCFAPNPYHDLESILWMALEFVIHRAPQTVDSAKVLGRPAKGILQEHAAKMFISRAKGAQIRSRFRYLTKPRHARALEADIRLIYGETHPFVALAGCLRALHQAYRELEDSDAASVIHLENGRTAFDPALFKGIVYDKLGATFSSISNCYARPRNAHTFVRAPFPKKPFFAGAPAKTDSEFNVGGSSSGIGSEAYTGKEGLLKEGKGPADDDTLGGGGFISRDASQTGADIDGVASGPQALRATDAES
ncbi:hypothetical protein GGG16DRAFT_116089 [Schizophyllum commune]